MKESLTFHTVIYSTSGFLIAIAGLISFPIITRVLSVEEYGILNLVSLTVMVLVALSKAGLQTSIIRFGSEGRSPSTPFRETDVYLTALATMLVIAIAVLSIWSVVSQFLPLSFVQDERTYTIFIIISMMVIGEVIGSGLHNILVSEKKSVVVSLFAIVKRYSLIAVVIPGLIYANDKLTTFYLLSGLHEILFLIVALYLCHRYFSIFRGRIDLSLNRQLFAYGLPLVAYELLTSAFAYGDRVQITYFLGTEALGLYAAASNLCFYMQTVIVISLQTAIAPMYMDRWENEGRAATEQFLSLALRYYLMLAIPAAIGVIAIGKDLITFLAGERYADAHRVIPFILTGMLIDGTSAVTAAGLRITKRTKLMMMIVASVVVLNLCLNFLLIPRFGIEGAATATLISFLCYTATNYYFGRQILTVDLDLRTIALYLGCGLIMYMIVSAIELQFVGFQLLAKIVVGGLVYSALVLLIDRDLRQFVITNAKPAWAMLKQRWA